MIQSSDSQTNSMCPLLTFVSSCTQPSRTFTHQPSKPLASSGAAYMHPPPPSPQGEPPPHVWKPMYATQWQVYWNTLGCHDIALPKLPLSFRGLVGGGGGILSLVYQFRGMSLTFNQLSSVMCHKIKSALKLYAWILFIQKSNGKVCNSIDILTAHSCLYRLEETLHSAMTPRYTAEKIYSFDRLVNIASKMTEIEIR